MAESTVGVDDAATPDKYFHTNQRSIGGTNKEDQFVIIGEPFHVTYTAIATTIVTTTSASHMFFMQGDGTLYTRVHWFEVNQRVLAGSAATAQMQVLRTSTAGTGGGAISARPVDAGDTDPYAGVCMTLPTAKGTEGNMLLQFDIGLVAAAPILERYRWQQHPAEKPLIIAPAIDGGLCWKIVTGIATSTLNFTIGFSVSNYL